jgi:hypothetical protein
MIGIQLFLRFLPVYFAQHGIAKKRSRILEDRVGIACDLFMKAEKCSSLTLVCVPLQLHGLCSSLFVQTASMVARLAPVVARGLPASRQWTVLATVGIVRFCKPDESYDATIDDVINAEWHVMGHVYTADLTSH